MVRKVWRVALAVLIAGLAAAAAFAGGEGEGDVQMSAPAAEMMAEYGDVWQWDTLQDYERDTGNTITQFGEAPMLAAMVAAGELPPVDERLPEEPLVYNVFEGIGTYGGTLKTASIGTEYTEVTPIRGLVGAVQTANRGPGKPIDIVPYIHKGWEMSDDQKTVTLYMRRGMKWSDGHPYTADDVMFSFEDFLLIDEFPSGWHRSGWGPMTHAEKVDDYTVRLHYSDPFPTLPGWYEFWGGWHPHSYPKHYLSKYHAKYNDNADALAKEEGFDNWVQAVWQKQSSGGDFRVQDLDTPSTKPWNHEEITTTYVLHVRNPYHFAIDPAGNQLPYIDRLRVETVADSETLNLKIIAGELSIAALGLATPDFPLFKENEESGGYQTLMWPRAAGAESFYAFNLTHQDPAQREVFQDVRFRQAMSLAINREEINKVLFFGLAVPRQAAMDPENSFYKEEWATRHAEYDPDTANRLLDEMGLERGGDGFRLRPDGEVLHAQILIPLEWPIHVAIGELVAEYWQDVGVKVDPRSYSIDLVGERLGTNDYDIAVWFLRRTNESKGYLPSNKFTSPDGHYAPLWWAWHNSGGESGEEPPPEFQDFFELAGQWYITADKAERDRIATQLFDFASEQVLLIGTVGYAPIPVVVGNEMGNVPRDVRYIGDDVQFLRDVKPDQWYIKQ